MVSFRLYVVMISFLACATSFVFAYLCFAPRMSMPAMDIRSPRSYTSLECTAATHTDSSWRFYVRNNPGQSFRLSNEREFTIMVRTPDGLKPAGPAVRIDVPVDLPAGETAPLTLHSSEGDRFVVFALRQGIKFELGQ